MSNHLTWHAGSVTPAQRAALLGHRPACLWFTGLSGSGKSTVGRALEVDLVSRGVHAYVLDGDNVRMGLNRDLGFGAGDRVENIRRVAELARLFVDSGAVVLTAFISPYAADRSLARALLGADFHEVHTAAGLAACEARDPKGLYAKARAGEIPDFTGVSAPYEAPDRPELRLDTASSSLADCVTAARRYLVDVGIISGALRD